MADIWDDLTEQIIEAMGIGDSDNILKEAIEKSIRKFVDERIIRCYFKSAKEHQP